MLYDPRRDVQSDPLLVTTLIAWLETQPPDELYCFSDKTDCLIAQYGAAHGRRGWDNLTCVDLTWLGFYNIAVGEPWTFGGALERARAEVSR
jgi:hypothetical protein